MDERVDATIVGHSYIARLHRKFDDGTFVARGPDGLRYNFIGVSGGRIYPPGCYKSLFHTVGEIRRRNPEIVFLHAGENDIGAEGVDYHVIVEYMTRLIEEIVQKCRPKVLIIGQLTQFPIHWRHGTVAKAVTRRLKQWVENRGHHMGETKLKVWQHKIKINGVNGGRFFDKDDVHLNPWGMRNYYKSVVAAVGRYARIVLEERRTQF